MIKLTSICKENPQSNSHGIPKSSRGEFHMFISPWKSHGIRNWDHYSTVLPGDQINGISTSDYPHLENPCINLQQDLWHTSTPFHSEHIYKTICIDQEVSRPKKVVYFSTKEKRFVSFRQVTPVCIKS